MVGRHRAARPSRARSIGMIILGTTCLVPATAAAQATSEPVTELETVTVTAERRDSTIAQSSATVSVKKAKDLERKLVKRPQDLVADEPGISIAERPNRTGAANYTIRGISDNRVKLLIDGVTVPDYPGVLNTPGSPGTYTRDVIDFDSLKQVDIVRGPASAIYGSDAIGGVIGFVTKDPSDFLKIFDKDWYLGAKVAYDSVDKSFTTTETVAGRSGPWSAMVLTTGRWGNEVRPNTSVPQSAYTDTVSNPQDVFQGNILAKLVYDTPDAGLIRLTVERFHKDVDTEFGSDLSSSILASTGADTSDRSRVSLDWIRDMDLAFADRMKLKAYYSGLHRTDETNQTRTSAAAPYYGLYSQWRKDTFQQDIYGGDAQLEKAFSWGGLQHSLTYGGTLEVTSTSRLSEGTRTTSNGTVLTSFGGDTYPQKRFPDTTTTNAGLFAQDVASIGALRIIPAVRLDLWHLEPKIDDLFLASGQTSVSEQTKLSVSPKLGATYDLNETYRLFGQYSHGFRAPPYDNVNYGFVNSAAGYEILANPNLKPEQSNGFEAGVRGRFQNGSSLQVSAFYNLYNDFISLQYIGTSGGLLQYQNINISRVRIFGAEAKGDWRFRPDWSAYGSIAYANGRDQDTGAAIDTVDPLTAVIGTRFNPAENWTLEAREKIVGDKHDVSAPGVVQTSAYALTDVFASWEPTRNVSLNAGVLNVFNRSYFDPADLAGLSLSGQALERYRAPGRSFAASLSVRF